MHAALEGKHCLSHRCAALMPLLQAKTLPVQGSTYPRRNMLRTPARPHDAIVQSPYCMFRHPAQLWHRPYAGHRVHICRLTIESSQVQAQADCVPFSADIHVPGRKRKVDGSRLEANDLEICRRPDGSRWLLGTGGFGQVTRLAATACLPGIVGGSDRHLHLVRT